VINTHAKRFGRIQLAIKEELNYKREIGKEIPKVCYSWLSQNLLIKGENTIIGHVL